MTPPPMSYKLILTDVEDPEVEKAIIAPLVAYNDSKAGPGNGRALVISIRDESGAVNGGLSGYTSRGWLFTHLLVVPAELRGQGVGTTVLRMAEREAVDRGSIGAWLDTFEFQARGFYEKMGYTCFGEIQDYPPGFSRFFMKKQLRSPASGA
jgi:GNAT superfamily N-acetyltransferase